MANENSFDVNGILRRCANAKFKCTHVEWIEMKVNSVEMHKQQIAPCKYVSKLPQNHKIVLTENGRWCIYSKEMKDTLQMLCIGILYASGIFSHLQAFTSFDEWNGSSQWRILYNKECVREREKDGISIPDICQVNVLTCITMPSLCVIRKSCLNL